MISHEASWMMILSGSLGHVEVGTSLVEAVT